MSVLAGCDDESSRAPADADVAEADLAPESDGADPDAADAAEIPTGPGSLRWDLAAALEDDFFAFPFPSDARRSTSGTPSLGSFDTSPSTLGILEDAIALIEAGPSGFSPLSAVYFAFSESVDPATLPPSVEATREAGASVFVADVTPASPEYGQRRPVTVSWREEVGIYWPARTLVIHPLYAIPLRTGTTYAAVVTRAVEGVDGPLEAPGVVAQLLEALERASPPPEALALAPLAAALGDLGLEPADLLAATVFTTSDPMAELRELVAWLREPANAPAASAWVEATPASAADFEVYEAELEAWELFSGEAPYRRFGDGLIALGPDGPATPTRVTLRLAVSVPTGIPPEGGWPVLLYSHGLGEDFRGFVRVAAAEMAARGVAVIGLDPPLQGGRNPTTQNDRDLIVSLSVGNIVAGREILRQGALDIAQLEALVASGLAIPGEATSSGAEIALDPTRVAFMGHSEGAQVGALFLPLAEAASAGVFSEGGGGGALTMLELELPEIDVAAVVAVALGVDEAVEPFDLDHPITSVVVQPLLDPADPLHCARELFAEPRTGPPHHLLVLEGFEDALTPPVVIEALASAARLPIAEPVGREIPGLALQGIDSVALPVSDNLVDGQGRRATGALVQFPEDDHYIIYFNEPGRQQIFDFLGSALEGDAALLPQPDL